MAPPAWNSVDERGPNACRSWREPLATAPPPAALVELSPRYALRLSLISHTECRARDTTTLDFNRSLSPTVARPHKDGSAYLTIQTPIFTCRKTAAAAKLHSTSDAYRESRPNTHIPDTFRRKRLYDFGRGFSPAAELHHGDSSPTNTEPEGEKNARERVHDR